MNPTCWACKKDLTEEEARDGSICWGCAVSDPKPALTAGVNEVAAANVAALSEEVREVLAGEPKPTGGISTVSAFAGGPVGAPLDFQVEAQREIERVLGRGAQTRAREERDVRLGLELVAAVRELDKPGGALLSEKKKREERVIRAAREAAKRLLEDAPPTFEGQLQEHERARKH